MKPEEGEAARLKAALAESPVSAWSQDRELRYTWLYNPHLGFTVAEVLGRTDAELLDGKSASEIDDLKRRVLATGEPAIRLIRTTRLEHSELHEIYVKPLLDPDGQPIGVTGTSTNVTRLADAEEALVKALGDLGKAERDRSEAVEHAELMMREVHHRIKNSLNLVATLLRTQRKGTDDEELAAALAEAENRIYSISAVHDRLARTGDGERIEFREYVSALIEDLKRSGTIPDEVETSVSGGVAWMDAKLALELGVMVTELIMNSVKHGMSDDRTSAVGVTLEEEDGMRRIIVADGGSGLPSGFDPRGSAGMGMRVVTALAEGLGGRLTTQEQQRGARFLIEVPEIKR